MKYKEEPPLKFKAVSKNHKKELIQWLSRDCNFFRFVQFVHGSSLFYKLKRLKIEISEKIESGKLILGEGSTEDDIHKSLYIVRSGNAFSWFGFNELSNEQKKSFTEIMVTEVKKRGIIDDFFCESDTLLIPLNLFENLLAVTTYQKKLSQLTGNVFSGMPFDKHIVPLVLLRIKGGELHSVFSQTEMQNMGFQYLYLKFISNRWKLWGQWTNKIDLKILSILYLYFIGELPLQCWITANGEKVDNKGVSFKKPGCLIKEFEIGTGNLALFVGLTRQRIYLYFSELEKTIFRKDKELASLLNCRVVPNEEFRFSSPEPLQLLSYIESKMLSPVTRKCL